MATGETDRMKELAYSGNHSFLIARYPEQGVDRREMHANVLDTPGPLQRESPRARKSQLVGFPLKSDISISSCRQEEVAA